jgi:phosphoribosylglycinamide formyltransferase-1
MKTVSFLISGRGSNFTAVAEKIQQGYIKAKIGVVISDKPEAKGLVIAREMGIDAVGIDSRDFASREEHEIEMVKMLKKYKTDLVVAAGYMRLLSPYFVNKYRNKMINIHPALLPAFPGVNSQKQAFDYGVKITGCTSHFVNEGTDSGPIIMQAAVSVSQDDSATSLAQKILKEEHRILPESVKLYCEGKLLVSGRQVIISG